VGWPWTHDEPIRVKITIEGSSDEVLRVIRRIASPKCRVQANVSARIISSNNRRRHEEYLFPGIERGDNRQATGTLDTLSRQRLVEAEVERSLDDIFSALAAFTRDSA
jgi:hypothetical protein